MISDIKRHSFRSGLPQEFEVVKLRELFDKHTSTLTAPHRAGFYHVLWFQKGSPTHTVDFNPVKLQPNTLLFLNKDIVHCFDKHGGFDGKAILFTDNFYCRTDQDSKFLRSSILFNDLLTISKIRLAKSNLLFLRLFQLMEEEQSNEKDRFQTGILQSLLHNFFLHAERERRKQNFTEIKQNPDLDYVMLFRDLLEADYKMQKQVSHYVRQLNVTEKRLNQATTRVLGKSPKQLIDERVVLEIKRLLTYTRSSIKEIGFELGFDEPTNFIKYFRKHHHSTPVEFRGQFSR